MNAVGRQEIDTSGIPIVKVVSGRDLRKPGFDRGNRSCILSDSGQIRLVVCDFADFWRKPVGRIEFSDFFGRRLVFNNYFHRSAF